MNSSVANATSEPTPHNDDYDGAAAFWIVIVVLVLLSTTFAAPWMCSYSWYNAAGWHWWAPYSPTAASSLSKPDEYAVPMGIPVEPQTPMHSPIDSKFPLLLTYKPRSSPTDSACSRCPSLSSLKV